MIAVIVVVVIAAATFAYLKFFHAATPVVGTLAVPAISAPTSTAAVNGASNQMVAPASAGAGVVPQTGAPTTSAAVTAAPQAAAPVAPPVDTSLQVAAGLVQKGERAYARGDYADASRQARAALKARPGDVAAERLQHRARDAQRRVAAEERAREQQAAAARAAAVAQASRPDAIYNQRAHSECRRGLFGKFCRHKIRQEVCQGVQPGSPGATVCSKNAD